MTDWDLPEMRITSKKLKACKELSSVMQPEDV